MKTLATVNVIVMDPTFKSIVSFPDDEAGNEAAEELFKKKVKEDYGELNEMDISCLLEDGLYENESGYTIYLVHSQQEC